VIHSLFVDANRCIGCRACVQACSECPEHDGQSMIHLDWLERATTVQTAPTVCMHCAEPSCVAVCPTDAIKIDPEGVVLSALPATAARACVTLALGCGLGVAVLAGPALVTSLRRTHPTRTADTS